MALTAGTRLGVYEVTVQIGEGGMGQVWRATDTKLKRQVAIKIVPPGLATDHDRLARFQREAEVLASLNHPHIAAIYGLEESGGMTALVMELVEGEDLSQRIAHGAIPLAEAVTIAKQIAEALEAAHEQGIIHRDLKPANIKVRSDGTVKVLDFGLAKVLDAAPPADLSQLPTITTPAQTRVGVIVGTPAYMSPEQARGKPVDKRTDIWAFGCVLYEMITGRAVFAGETVSDMIARILEREPDWGRLPATTPPSIRRLLERCLEKASRERLRDIGDARGDLDAVNRDLPPLSGETTATRRSLAGNARLAWFVAAGLAAALGFAIWARGLVDVASGSKPPTLSRATRVTNTPAEEFGPAISPDNKWVAYYSTARGPTDIWVRFLDSGATLNLTESTTLSLPVRTGLGGLAISPDGTKLAFYARPDASETTYDTWVIPVPIGGSPHRLIQGMQGLQWSPDGSQITCILPGSSRGDALVLASSDGSNPKIIVPAEAGRHIHWPAWSHDGRHIYFISTLQPWNSEPAEIFRVTAGGGAPEAIVRTARRAVYPVPMAGGDLIYAANPDHADLGLWWRPASGGVGKPLTTGVGEHTEARLSADGSKLVSTFVELRQALVSFPASTSGSTAAAPMRAITDGYSGDLDPDIDPHGERLVFSSSRSGDRNLWTAKLDGTDARPLTSGTFIDERPAFSPDGSQIAFVSDRGGQRGIWLVSAGGGVPKRLAPVDVLDGLTWSRDGARVFVAQPDRGLPALAAVSVADGRIERFPTPAAAVVPAASPTADAIAYLEPTTVAGREALSVPATSYALKFVDLAGHPLHTDLPAQRLGNGFLVWAPDGRRLVEVSVTANTPASVWIIEPDSRTPFRKLLDLPGAVRPRGVTWTHDGSSLIIASQQSVSDIVLYDVGR